MAGINHDQPVDKNRHTIAWPPKSAAKTAETETTADRRSESIQAVRPSNAAKKSISTLNAEHTTTTHNESTL